MVMSSSSSSHNKRRRPVQDDDQRAGGKKSRWSKQHLYLVLDDWVKGFTIHKIDADSFDDGDGDGDYSSSLASGSGSGSGSDDGDIHQCHHHRLPETPLLRFESPAAAGEDQSYLSASGTKMFFIVTNAAGGGDDQQRRRSSLVYDAGTGVLAVGTPAPPRMTFGSGVCMPVGDVLYLLSYRHLDAADGHHSFDEMSWSPAVAVRRRGATASAGAGGGGWAWKTLPSPPPTFAADQLVVAHAVHPDGRTIFMTTARRGAPGTPVGTHSFDTREATWRWHGERPCLPFAGEAHFDGELGAWVGLHVDGHVCASQVISPDSGVSAQPPPPPTTKGSSRWDYPAAVDDDHHHPRTSVYLEHRITEEKVFGDEERCTMTRASLSCMGAGRYCLVEWVPSKVPKRKAFGDKDGCVLYVTVFGLKYNHMGELQITNHRSKRSFLVSRHRSYFAPFAFWA